MNKIKGNLYIILSAFIFGFTPVIGKLSYLEGSNSTMLTLFRSLLCLPFLFGILKIQGISLGISKRQLKELLLLAGVGSAFTSLTLYHSYAFIPVGTATTLHFVYPIFVAFGSLFIFKEKLTPPKMIALTLATTGIAFFFGGATNLTGILLSLVSGLSYAFYILYLGHTDLLTLPPLKLSFYINVIIASCLLLFGFFSGTLTLSITPLGYFYSLSVALLCGIIGITLFQVGLKMTGGTTAAILSMFEPITSVLVGAFLIGEPLTIKSILGCFLILSGVTLLTVLKSDKA